MANDPLVVQAVYTFKATNNDELCFKKGDIITVTQKDEGWWEGTLNGKTGWFPSNYVKEYKDGPKPVLLQQNEYKTVVLKDLIESEKAHVTELEGLVKNFLQPLEPLSLLTHDEYKQLINNITEVLDVHQQFLKTLESESSKSGSDQKVGKLFLTWAPKVKTTHHKYCSLHPKAVCILDKYRDELGNYMESRGATSPGILVLTTMLSKPFRRLDKYSGMLQELERHVEECHPDRGDIQRSVSVYKELAESCFAIRRQKELELQVLTGPVRGWEGPSLSTLGDIIYMNSVSVGHQKNERYFVLFPTTLLRLSVSHSLSAFIYEGQLCLSGLLEIVKLEDGPQYKNAFEINALLIDKIIVSCHNKNEVDKWVELLSVHLPRGNSISNVPEKNAPSSPVQFVSHQDDQNNPISSNSRKHQAFYDIKFPIQCYPPAALTKYFSRKIKDKTITRKLIRNLLYTEYLNKMNINSVKIRHHRTECYIVPQTLSGGSSMIYCDNQSESDDNSISESNSSSSSNAFGYIRYYNPNSTSKECDSNPKRQRSTLVSSIKIHLQPRTAGECSLQKFEHVSTLQLSDASRLKDPTPVSFAITRQSCPIKFVGNRFNENSLTLVPLPNWLNGDNFEAPSSDDEESVKKSESCHTSKMNLTLNISAPTTSDNHAKDSNIPKECRCSCSQRSSDSGMVESCRLNSVVLTNSNDPSRSDSAIEQYNPEMINSTGNNSENSATLSELETEARRFEEQCPCTSPFGSTPRTSYEMPMIQTITTVTGDSNRNSSYSANEENLTYKSGLYAHWWLKAKIPKEVIRGIYDEANKSTAEGKNTQSLPTIPPNPAASSYSGRASTGARSPNVPDNIHNYWSSVFLRPPPPLRTCLAPYVGRTASGPYCRHARKPLTNNEDGLILEVIEAYCAVVK